jgi:hypothetical protein
MSFEKINYELMEKFIEIPYTVKNFCKGYIFVPRNEWMETIKIGDKIRLIDIKTQSFKKGGTIVEIGDGWNWVKVLPYGSHSTLVFSALYYAIWYKPIEETQFDKLLKNVVSKCIVIKEQHPDFEEPDE